MAQKSSIPKDSCNDPFESNRAAWNEAMGYHREARGCVLLAGFEDPAYSVFDRDCDGVLLEKLRDIDLKGKTIAQLPCNNGRELLSLARLGGAREAVGFDISDEAIEEARALARIADAHAGAVKPNVHFERLNILNIGEEYSGRFDFIYISEGSLQWFPDLDAYFSVVGRLLKPGGTALIFEMHPFAYFFETGFDPAHPDFDRLTPYFDKGPHTYKTGLDYVGGVDYAGEPCFWFMHTLSDILNAVAGNGMTVRSFDEYNLEMANNPRTVLLNKFPLSYILIANKL
jgi:SAM-dependent methyltransferase